MLLYFIVPYKAIARNDYIFTGGVKILADNFFDFAIKFCEFGFLQDLFVFRYR